MSKCLEALHDLYLGINIHESMIICEKALKALEIIKEKQVNMFYLLITINWHNPSHYNDSTGCTINCELTKEEFDLLKEVLNYGE